MVADVLDMFGPQIHCALRKDIYFVMVETQIVDDEGFEN